VEIPDGSGLFSIRIRTTTVERHDRLFVLKDRMLLVERPVVAVRDDSNAQAMANRTARPDQDHVHE